MMNQQAFNLFVVKKRTRFRLVHLLIDGKTVYHDTDSNQKRPKLMNAVKFRYYKTTSFMNSFRRSAIATEIVINGNKNHKLCQVFFPKHLLRDLRKSK